MTDRSREVELAIARRAIEHAKRRAAEAAAGDDVAARLRAVADDDEQLTVDAALAALSRDPNRDGTPNPVAEQVARAAARQQDAASRLLARYSPTEVPTNEEDG